MLSDHQKGLLEGVELTFPDSPHGYCMRHLDDNFRKEFKHPELKKLLWRAAYATTKEEYNDALSNMDQINPQARIWLHTHAPAKHWATCYFDGNRYGHLTSNIAESLNHWIHDAREQPILSMLETIRRQLVKLFTQRRGSENITQGILVSTARDSIQNAMGLARRTLFLQNTETIYEVHSKHTGQGYTIDLAMQTCKCRQWQTSGIPCYHAIAIILSRKEDPQMYAKSFFSLEAYRNTYANAILHPEHDNFHQDPFHLTDHDAPHLSNLDDSDSESNNPLLPPKTRRAPGRPKKRRIRGQQEIQVADVEQKRRQVQKCGKCKQPGHSKQTCSTVIG